MKKRFCELGIVVVFTIIVSFFTTLAIAGNENLFASIKDASWAIYTRNTGGMSASCSAIALKSDNEGTFLLSAAHCFTGSDLQKTDFLVTQDHRTFFRATLYRSGLKLKKGMRETSSDLDDYEGNDWAIVKAEVYNKSTMPVGDSDKLKIGEDILAVGVPFGLDFLAVQGIIGSKDVSLSTYVWNHYYGGNVYVASGNSGSGVISVKQKAIIGIVNAGPGSQSNMLIFMPINLLPDDYLKPNKP